MRLRSRLRLVVAVGLLGALGALVPCAATAQTSALGYVFYGPVLVDNLGTRDSKTAWHIGGGGEKMISPKVGVGGEIGSVYFPLAEMQIGCCGHSRAPARWDVNLSLNGSFHFARAGSTRRAQPFVTGGYTRFRGGVEMLNVGGGLNWWPGRRAGVRFEIRDHLRNSSLLLGLRAGVVFR